MAFWVGIAPFAVLFCCTACIWKIRRWAWDTPSEGDRNTANHANTAGRSSRTSATSVDINIEWWSCAEMSDMNRITQRILTFISLSTDHRGIRISLSNGSLVWVLIMSIPERAKWIAFAAKFSRTVALHRANAARVSTGGVRFPHGWDFNGRKFGGDRLSSDGPLRSLSYLAVKHNHVQEDENSYWGIEEDKDVLQNRMELHGETNDPCDPEKIREGDEIPQPSVCFLPRMLSRAALRYLEKCCHFHEMFNSGW